jgi:hypothetical protein
MTSVEVLGWALTKLSSIEEMVTTERTIETNIIKRITILFIH